MNNSEQWKLVYIDCVWKKMIHIFHIYFKCITNFLIWLSSSMQLGDNVHYAVVWFIVDTHNTNSTSKTFLRGYCGRNFFAHFVRLFYTSLISFYHKRLMVVKCIEFLLSINAMKFHKQLHFFLFSFKQLFLEIWTLGNILYLDLNEGHDLSDNDGIYEWKTELLSFHSCKRIW